MLTYNPGDALFGKGLRDIRGETGAVGAVSNDLRGNNGDSVFVFEIVCRVDVFVITGINPLWK